MYLFNEYPLFANRALAKELGLNEAIVLQQIHFWLESNKKSGVNFIDGRYWTFNTMSNWHKNDFDYMSLTTLKRTFKNLTDKGYLIAENFNRNKFNATKWYSIDYDALEALYKSLDGKRVNTSDIQDVDIDKEVEQEEVEAEEQMLESNEDKAEVGSLEVEKIEEKRKSLVDKFREYGDINKELLEIIEDVYMLDDEDYISINGRKLKAHFVKKRFDSIGYDALEFANMQIKRYEGKINNFKTFTTTLLYNAIS